MKDAEDADGMQKQRRVSCIFRILMGTADTSWTNLQEEDTLPHNLSSGTLEQTLKRLGHNDPAVVTLKLLNRTLTLYEVNELRSSLLVSKSLATLDLQRCGIGAAECVVLSEGLERSLSLSQLVLSGNPIRDGAHKLGSSLLVNTTVTSLTLRDCAIGPVEWASFLKDAGNSKSLVKLDISKNSLGAKGASGLASALSTSSTLTALRAENCGIEASELVTVSMPLKMNSSLKVLELSDNRICDEGARVLGAALSSSYFTLTLLHLENCEIESSGCTALIEGLRKNSTLKDLDLSDNSICNEGGSALGMALAASPSLTSLRVVDCKIGPPGCTAIAEGLSRSCCLEKLDLTHNFLGEGARSFGDAVAVCSTLTSLVLLSNTFACTDRCDRRRLGATPSSSHSLDERCCDNLSITSVGIAHLLRGLRKSSSLMTRDATAQELPDAVFQSDWMAMTHTTAPKAIDVAALGGGKGGGNEFSCPQACHDDRAEHSLGPQTAPNLSTDASSFVEYIDRILKQSQSYSPGETRADANECQ